MPDVNPTVVIADCIDTDLRKFLCMSVVSFSSHGTIAGGTYRAGKAGAQATAQSERIRR